MAQQFTSLQDFCMSRSIRGKGAMRYELHAFCDSCSYGCGACLYLKSIDQEGIANVTLISSKSRVALLKGMTSSCLELCVASALGKLVLKV